MLAAARAERNAGGIFVSIVDDCLDGEFPFTPDRGGGKRGGKIIDFPDRGLYRPALRMLSGSARPPVTEERRLATG